MDFLTYTLLVERASNLKGIGVGIVQEKLDNLLIEQWLKFEFKASNNQAKCEALIVD